MSARAAEEGGVFWEPVTFDVGQRVQVARISPECPSHRRDDPRTVALLDGLRGLADWLGGHGFPGHVYHVTFDAEVPAWTSWGEPADMDGGYFAACELIPLPDAPGRRDRGEGGEG